MIMLYSNTKLLYCIVGKGKRCIIKDGNFKLFLNSGEHKELAVIRQKVAKKINERIIWFLWIFDVFVEFNFITSTLLRHKILSGWWLVMCRVCVGSGVWCIFNFVRDVMSVSRTVLGKSSKGYPVQGFLLILPNKWLSLELL